MYRVVVIVAKLLPSYRAQTVTLRRRAIEFDELYGVDTAMMPHEIKPLSIDNSKTNFHSYGYAASDPNYFLEAMNHLEIDHKEYTFIDFGSGKGRALLMASQFPFRKILGVEFLEELHEIAKQNIAAFQKHAVGCCNLESTCMDVLDLELPKNNLVCYFYNPFSKSILNQVLASIHASFMEHPREILVVYYAPSFRQPMDEAVWLTKQSQIGPVCIWRTEGRYPSEAAPRGR